MKYVRITKISASKNPVYDTPKWENYEQGKINKDYSLPIDYWVEGYLHENIEVGKPVVIDRVIRNGLETSGLMSTSTVIEINDNFFETFNSLYRVEYKDPKKL